MTDPTTIDPAAQRPAPDQRARLVVLISGGGSNLAALFDASDAADVPYEIVAVLSDLEAPGLDHARDRGIETAVVRLDAHPDRAAWDAALAEEVLRHRPDLVVLAGFMKLLGLPLLEALPGRILNTHPALLPSFPGAHGVRDALAHGVKVSGVSIIEVDAGIDTGRILAQRAVDVHDDDTEHTLHERIKAVERPLLVDVVVRLAANLPAPLSQGDPRP